MTKMEDEQNGRRAKWKTTTMEDDQNGRRPKWKKTKMEDDQNGGRPKKKTHYKEDKLVVPKISALVAKLLPVLPLPLCRKTGHIKSQTWP